VSGARNSSSYSYSPSFVTSSLLSCSTVGSKPGADTDTTINTFAAVADNLPLEEISVDDKVGSKDFQVLAMPNPSSTIFNLQIKGTNDSPVTVKILDMFGQVVEVHQKIASNTSLKVGRRLAAGSYFAEVTQGNQRKIVRLVKVN
jgi:hypothetical protein